MVSRDFQALAARRAARAHKLAERYPASCEALQFFGEIAAWQSDFSATLPAETANLDEALDSLLPGRQTLIALVEATGPPRLRDETLHYDEKACRDSLRDYYTRGDTQSARSLFARVLLQPGLFTWDLSSWRPKPPNAADERGQNCPRCGHAPQAGCLRPHGDGAALSLACSLCLHEWPFTRLRCPGCGEGGHQKLSFYSTAEFPHLEVQVCESCKTYLHLIHLEKDSGAVADADEMAALPLDVWAQQQGYRKIQPNLAGI